PRRGSSCSSVCLCHLVTLLLPPPPRSTLFPYTTLFRSSLFKQKFDPETGQRMTYYNTQIPNEPFFTINGNVHYRLQHIFQKESELSLFYTLGYVHPFRTVWPESDWFVTPAQYVQRLGVSYRFPDRKLTASLDLKDLLNAEIYDNFGVQKPGRAIYLKVTYTLHNLCNK